MLKVSKNTPAAAARGDSSLIGTWPCSGRPMLKPLVLKGAPAPQSCPPEKTNGRWHAHAAICPCLGHCRGAGEQAEPPSLSRDTLLVQLRFAQNREG